MADDDLLASLFNNKSLIIYLKTSVVTSELISDRIKLRVIIMVIDVTLYKFI